MVSVYLRLVDTYLHRALNALGDPTRRAIFERLSRGPSAVGDLARELPISRPAVSQHLKVLKEAGLVVDDVVGTRHLYRLNPQGIQALQAYFHQFWSLALAEFRTTTERKDEPMTQQTSASDVRVVISVEAPIERAFEVFTTRGHDWWPRAYGIGETERVDLVLEPRAGGRWYERAANGQESDWGKVLVWDPPHHLVLSWQIGVGFVPESDPERASRVDVRFVADSEARTIVTLVHSGFERHGAGWESLRDGVAHEGGWPGVLEAYAKLVAS